MTLYQNAVTFAMRKQLQAEHGRDDLMNQITELKNEKKRQINRVIEIKARITALNQRNLERKEIDTKKRDEEKRFLEFQLNHLKDFLRQI